MIIVESYPVAVIMCFITMLCWGSWANTQKLAAKTWPFQLYYWDYGIGVLLLTVLFAFTLGSFGSSGRGFVEDLGQAGGSALWSAFLGGIVFNLANILLVAAIDIAGMAVAFPVGIGLALVIGVIKNYVAAPVGNPVILFIGVALVGLAILVNAAAYRRLPAKSRKTTVKGIVISIAAGILMGFFYRYVAASMATNTANPETGFLTPYTALVVFSLGLFASNFVFNSLMMAKPFAGERVHFGDYLTKGDTGLHFIGILGGVIWGVGMAFSIIASNSAGYAISYGLGQGATMIGAFWGVFIWKEFKDAPKGTGVMLGVMFISFIAGLGLIIASRVM